MTNRIYPDIVIQAENGCRFYKQPDDAADWLAQFPTDKVVGKRWEPYAFPGGYEIHYYTKDGGVLCHQCANDNLDLTVGDDQQWMIVAAEINYEDSDCYCDNCNRKIEPAYGEDDDQP